MLLVSELDGVRLMEAPLDSEEVGVGVGVGLGDTEGEAETLVLGVGLAEMVDVCEGVTLLEAEMVGVCEGVTDVEGVGAADGPPDGLRYEMAGEASERKRVLAGGKATGWLPLAQQQLAPAVPRFAGPQQLPTPST